MYRLVAGARTHPIYTPTGRCTKCATFENGFGKRKKKNLYSHTICRRAAVYTIVIIIIIILCLRSGLALVVTIQMGTNRIYTPAPDLKTRFPSRIIITSVARVSAPIDHARYHRDVCLISFIVSFLSSPRVKPTTRRHVRAE